MYSIKEIFCSIQGEGERAGRLSVFCRFSGCNLWSGREIDRSDSVCKFCDTDFVGVDGQNGGKYSTPDELAKKIDHIWSESTNSTNYKYVVLTGGEPLLQLDDELIQALHHRGFEIAIETNGTIAPPKDIDWICVSPKLGSNLVLNKGDELKLVVPQIGVEITDSDINEFEKLEFKFFYLQPLDSKDLKKNIETVLKLIKDRPKWKIGLQLHKILNLD